MFEFISREFVFKECPQLAQRLMAYQQAMYNPSDNMGVEGEEFFLGLNDEFPTVLTKEQADQLNIEHVAHCVAMCDNFEGAPINTTFYQGVIAELDVPSFDVFTENIGQSLKDLAAALGWEDIIAICDSRTPYLAQENTFAPVRNAVQKLLAMGMTRTFIDGVRLNRNTCAQFFSSVFWIVRCNASAPGICFSSSNSNIVGTLCKYGNIHFECYSSADSRLLRDAMKTTNFKEVPNGICFENFSESGAINGRQLFAEQFSNPKHI